MEHSKVFCVLKIILFKEENEQEDVKIGLKKERKKVKVSKYNIKTTTKIYDRMV